MNTDLRRALALTLALALVILAGAIPACAGETDGALVAQGLDYTEAPVDVPNPDRGFYRANDGMVVPVTATPESLGQRVNVGAEPVEVAGVTVQTRVSHIYFDLRNYSSNAFTDWGLPFDEEYEAPEDVSIASRGDAEPWDYETNFEYWLEHDVPAWPHGESQDITEDGLAYIRAMLGQVRDGEGVTLVRFSYDGPGFSWVYCDHPEDGEIDTLIADVEPDRAQILRHIEQLKPILEEYEDVIMAVDGGMFGPWGEMHSTAFGTSPEAYKWLIDAWLDAVPESRSILVQPGAYLSWYNATYGTAFDFATIDQIPAPAPGSPESRLGFFNDSYAYGTDDPEWIPDDWGSLAEGLYWPDNPYGDETDFDRGKMMTRIRLQNSFYGGEAQGGETLWNIYPFVAFEGAYAQTVYLNADYSEEVHERWAAFEYTEANVCVPLENAYAEPYTVEQAVFDPVYAGKNGVEYWRDRLGYRLVLRDANAPESVTAADALRFEGKVQNVGFGNIVNRKNVTVILRAQADGATWSALTDIDAREWRPDLDSRADNTAAWRDLRFSIPVSAFGDVPAGTYDILLKINDPKEQSANKRCVRFANNGDIWDEALGANRIGAVGIVEAP